MKVTTRLFTSAKNVPIHCSSEFNSQFLVQTGQYTVDLECTKMQERIGTTSMYGHLYDILLFGTRACTCRSIVCTVFCTKVSYFVRAIVLGNGPLLGLGKPELQISRAGEWWR